ncbi:hypothetical protein Tco_1367227, partial [Tanacetum coccineum]
MDNSKRGNIPMQERLDLNITQGSSTSEEVKCVVEWKRSKQSTTVMSAIKAEYIAASAAAIEVVRIRKIIFGFGIVPTNIKHIKMYYDNSAAIIIANEPGVQKGIEDIITFAS